MRRLIFVGIAALIPLALVAQDQKGYYRFPTVGGDRIVFSAEGDLWSVGTMGGAATRLTTHPADEARPAISPDGSQLAFSASYEGPTEVYVMPATGGLPRRLTYEGGARVTGWTPDGRILFQTRNYATLPNAQLVAIDPTTGRRDLIPLAQAAEGSYDPSGNTLYFTRFAEQGSRTKRYKGGTAQSIWKFSPGQPEAQPLTPDYAGTSRNPMWWNGRVYFETDRDGTMNLWSMNTDGGDLVQHTHHVGWDVKTPSLGNGRIAYQLGADLWLYDIASGNDRELDVFLTSDFDQMRERWVDNPMDYLDTWHLGPSGDRIALTARGKVFVAPVTAGRFVEATRKRGVRYRTARFLPDGKSLAVLSDESGEVEWWRVSALGIAEPEQLSSGGTVVRMDGIPSPDGKWIVHWNHDQELWLTNTITKESSQIAFSPRWGIDQPTWSADSKWIVYGKPAHNDIGQLHLYNVANATTTPLTTDRFNSGSATWSSDGKWIYFLSDRNFRSLVRSPWGTHQPEPFFDKSTKIYALALEPGLRSPFQLPDELHAEESSEDAAGNKKNGVLKPITIDLDGIRQRVVEIPVPAGNYSNLSATEKRLFWIERETALPRTASLMALDIDNDKPKAKKLVEGIRGYEISADGKKIAVRKGDALYVFKSSAAAGIKLADSKVDLSGWKFALDPQEDWRQIFLDSWRLERDYFYDPNMHGVDWDAMLQKYLPLVDRVRSRGDLADLQAQMAAEISALHTFVRGGDFREGPEDITTATLGAVLTRDERAGGYRVDHIYRSDPDLPDELSPLARFGVDVNEGDVITAINGVTTLSVADVRALLRNQTGKQVRLTVLARESHNRRDVMVTPISSRRDADLRYDEWEYTRRLAVDSLGNGDIGYVHLRAMGSGNIAEWYRNYYPVFDRKGLVIDVRHNRGGNIESWILEKLLRKAWMYWQPRVGDAYWNMQYAFRGHIVVLVDESTASDGEAFAEGFKRLGLGKVIGTRTWGGEVWLTSSNRLVDRGIVTAAEFGVYGPDGTWLVEGHGVDPDVVIDNLPHATFLGEDAQLKAGIEHLQALIEADPRPVPVAPDYPDKSSDDNRKKASATRTGGRQPEY
ncbi:MAG: S41 family peptidase [Gemmatimonadales bacterium]